VLGDASQIHQVVMNLATNALQAMGEAGGTLEIGVERLGEGTAGRPATLAGGRYMILSVRDTGPGILPQIKERIFEPFFTTREIGGGTGLGLSVAHGIAKSHGGAISCESEPGRGATFRVYLPEAGDVVEGRDERGTPASAEPLRVLLVDDDETVVYVGKGVLEGLGHRVTATCDGLEALERFRQEPDGFDLAILDELMPRMSGSQLAAELRRLRPRLPVVIASGHGLPSGARFDSHNTFVYLSKPFEARDLVDAVGVALDHRRGSTAP
jgi:CheY-like chemotaxis protein